MGSGPGFAAGSATESAMNEQPRGRPHAPGTQAFNWVTQALAVGGAFDSGQAARIVRDHAISHVVDLRDENCHDRLALHRAGMRLLHLPTPDKCAVDLEHLRVGVAWVIRAQARGRRVLVHCQHGIGRSALLSLCVLVQQGMDPVAAMNLVKNAREIVSPSPAQLERFIVFARESWRPDGDWVIPSFDTLACIAYRHLAK
jgi:protein-tyrosine phosphatase